ncbi:MAG TPA: sigma-70 family RNA polymerase sigma factor [Galbitalea sp.]|nr:sigma-70 family RNA polymerase sigma factor [Galbitalea sp.]
MESNNPDESDWHDARRGDGLAFARVFDRYANRIARHALRLVPSPHDVEDVVAVTFMEAWRRRDNIRFIDGSMLPWLLVTATNSARNLSRAARRHRALLDRLPPVATSGDFVDTDETAPTEIALRSLSVPDQQLITLCELYGYSAMEAAAVLGISSTAVRSRLSRARFRLALAARNESLHVAIEGESS